MEAPHIKATEAYPPELHYVKVLLLQKQYRQCIAASREVIGHDDTTISERPLQHTFAQVYLALAHDELARAMHNFSQAKIPAFNEAEYLYRDALASLPEPGACLKSSVDAETEDRHDSCQVSDSTSRHTSMNAISNQDNSRPLSYAASPPRSPPTHIRNRSLPFASPSTESSSCDSSDLDDLESHESFNQILTANRLPKLQRDYSSMSLLQNPPPKAPHGLMRPVRLGSMAKPYQLPPRHSYSGPNQQQRAMLPKLNTTTSHGSPIRKQLRTASEQVSPVEPPVSPLGSEDFTFESDASTISPISPETPLIGKRFDGSSLQKYQDYDMTALSDHLQAMRVQLESHIKLIQEAKYRTLKAQAERSAARKAPNNGGMLTSMIDAASAKNKQLPQARSYWSFTPEDVKVLEEQRRIEAGRDRGWKRKRFDPTRYRELGDAALAEL